MLTRSPLLLALFAASAVFAGLFTSLEPAYSLSPADVQGIYVLRLSGEAWIRTRGQADTTARADQERVKSEAYLILEPAEIDANDGRVRAEIRLSKRLEGSVLDRLTASPDFQATGVIFGDRLTLIDTGHELFVNALDLRFQKGGKKVGGAWLVSWPASQADAAFAGGAGLAVKGKRFVSRRSRPSLELPPVDGQPATVRAR